MKKSKVKKSSIQKNIKKFFSEEDEGVGFYIYVALWLLVGFGALLWMINEMFPGPVRFILTLIIALSPMIIIIAIGIKLIDGIGGRFHSFLYVLVMFGIGPIGGGFISFNFLFPFFDGFF